MELFFVTIIFLAFCITIIALSAKHAGISKQAIRKLVGLGKLSRGESGPDQKQNPGRDDRTSP